MGRGPNQVRTTGISIFGLAIVLLTVMLMPIMALLRATKGTVWHKFVIMGLIGFGYFAYMDVARTNKCNLQPPSSPCPRRIADFIPHD
jgi:hypothetical protein